MAKTLLSNDLEILVTGTTTARTSGETIRLGTAFHGVVQNAMSLAAGTSSAVVVTGKHRLTKDTVKGVAQGGIVFYDTTAKKATGTSTGNQRLGRATVAASTGNASIDVLINFGI